MMNRLFDRPPIAITSGQTQRTSADLRDLALVWVARLLALVAGIVVLLIVIFLVAEAAPALTSIGLVRFFTDQDWHPTADLYNLAPMLLGTLLAMVGAVLLATPLGIISGIFCHYYAPPKLSRIYRNIIEILAGIPSVVYGFWGLVVLVPLLGRLHPPGQGLLASILILTLMILPTSALTVDAGLACVPQEYLRGSAALGLPRWSMIRGIILPAIKPGLLTGIILQVGRAIGETMAVLMVAGNVVQVPQNLFAPFRTLTANIALEMAYATGTHRAALFVSGLVLMALIVILMLIADRLSKGQGNG
jgi:phosphate transport system permease protein